MTGKLASLNEQIQKLKQQREKIQIQQALLLTKEAQKIFKDDFSPELTLTILNQSWGTASETQKREWKKSCLHGGEEGHSFRPSPPQADRKKTSTADSTHHQT